MACFSNSRAPAGDQLRALTPQGREVRISRKVRTRIPSICEVLLLPSNRGFNRIKSRNGAAKCGILSISREDGQFRERKDVVVLPRSQFSRSNANVPRRVTVPIHAFRTQFGIRKSFCDWSFNIATFFLNAGSSDASTLNLTGNPKPFPILLKSSSHG